MEASDVEAVPVDGLGLVICGIRGVPCFVEVSEVEDVAVDNLDFVVLVRCFPLDWTTSVAILDLHMKRFGDQNQNNLGKSKD